MELHTLTYPGAYADEAIGTVTFAEEIEDIREHHTSYAADHRTYRVLPGVYEARLTRRGDHATMANVIVTVDIEVTNETLHSGVGGVNYHTDTDDTVRKSTKTYSFYEYLGAEAAMEKDPILAGGAFRLNPEWIVVVSHTVLPALATSPEKHHTVRQFAKLS